MKIEVLPNIKLQFLPNLLGVGRSKAVSKYGDTVCLVFGDTSPSGVASYIEEFYNGFGQKVRYPHFVKLQDFF